MLELKEYQEEALDAFTHWLGVLREQRAAAESLEDQLSALPADAVKLAQDYPRNTWNELEDAIRLPPNAGAHVSRTDGMGRPIPHICFKVPTGGGKTLLGVAAIERLHQQTGLVLWFVPSKAIYAQTKAALWNKEHPYRQLLERASGGKVKVLEKDDPFTKQDVQHYLCVMLISLQGANRKNNQEFLKMFRASGRYASFFPDDDDLWRMGQLRQAQPDLDPPSGGALIHQSLANVFRLTRPVVVLDEAHKAYGKSEAKEQEFVSRISRFNPSMMIELTATPHAAISNLLVNIGGPALKREEMIKLPIQVRTTSNADWHETLALAVEELDRLEQDAERFLENSGRYIRPIAVVRVERTGKDQQGADKIHSEDARAQLEQLGVPADQIAVKSAEVDDITSVDLMSPYSPIRWIITKAALMEGWDCSFAYVLVVLDNTQSKRAITQLVGRVMRQPEARRTDIESLNQCYVYCAETSVGEAMSHVKNGLEQEGMGDLIDDVHGDASELTRVEFRRRAMFVDKEICLPLVLHDDGGKWVELDYHRHILPGIRWDEIRIENVQSSMLNQPVVEFGTVDVGEEGAIASELLETELAVDVTPSLTWYARRLGDLIPNPWQAARVASDVIADLRAADQSDEQIYRQRITLVDVLRTEVRRQIEQQGERLFKRKLADGVISFSLRAQLPSHLVRAKPYQVPLPSNVHELQRGIGRQLELSLFVPVIEEHFDSELEKRFARYLDEQKALEWWHRVGVRQSGEYYVRGWKQERIWPDFIAMAVNSSDEPHLLVFETKGDHLKDTEDTRYKQRVMDLLQDGFNSLSDFGNESPRYGQLTVEDGPLAGTFRLVFDQQTFDVIEQALKSS
ncbi:MAG: restriction endonuclease subunit R [Chloroflexi bacterium]|nr:restriction endonuclease subunit R [Chloroflexota bacterium]MYF23203.1 restriction endonuclease subunit R [Chloroflexota bacterium]